MTHFVPTGDHLTGGTLLTLLTAAFRTRRRTRSFGVDYSDGLTSQTLVQALIRIVDKDWEKPRGDTFEQDVSQYRSCRKNKSACLTMTDQRFHEDFHEAITHNYQTLAKASSSVIDNFIDVNGQGLWLVRALLTLVNRDTQIPVDMPFHVIQDGTTITKEDLLVAPVVCIDTLVLGLWFYALTSGVANRQGRETFERWHKPRSNNRMPWEFDREAFNVDTTRAPKVTRWEDWYKDNRDPGQADQGEEIVVDAEIVNDDDSQTGAHDTSRQEPPPATAATAQFVFQQTGNKNTQIGHVNTLYIATGRQ